MDRKHSEFLKELNLFLYKKRVSFIYVIQNDELNLKLTFKG